MAYTVLKTFENYFTANIFLGKMQEAGIDCRLMNEDVVTTVPFLTNIVGGIKLVVNDEFAEEAKAILLGFEENYRNNSVCPKCGSKGMELIQKKGGDGKFTSIIGWLADNYPLNTLYVYQCKQCGFETENLPEVEDADIEAKPLKKIAVIPARYASTRFPYKLVQPLGNKTVIRHTYDNTVATGLFDDVFVVTDHEKIYNEIIHNGGKAIMSIKEHESGSDRIAEAIADMDVDVVLNVQGDEPFVKKEALAKLLNCFEGSDGNKVQVASLYKKMENASLANDPNYVKVVLDNDNSSLYFSRSAVPFYRDDNAAKVYLEHVGVYAFRKQILLEFTKWPMGKLETIEKLEQLRYLEHGIKLKMVETTESSVKIDVPEDLAKAEIFLKGL